jgi:Zn-dependent protease
MTCPDCGEALDTGALSCPRCSRLTHAARLESLAAEARAAALRADHRAERAAWEQAISLLPADTVQYRSIQGRLTQLPQEPEHTAGPHFSWKKVLIAVGPTAFLLWKIKAIPLFLLGKGKLLLLGFTKAGTLLSMAASLGVYWSMYGWWFALGLVLSIYIHEMGHVAALRHYGIPAGAPMFIPGFGAFIRLRALNLDPVRDARIGLAGPLYGLGAALVAFAMYIFTGLKVWAVIAHFGALINLFNLIPVWQLDGSRGLRSMTLRQRRILLWTCVALWLISSGPMLLLVIGGLIYRMFRKDAAPEPDRPGLIYYIGLLAALSWVMAASV